MAKSPYQRVKATTWRWCSRYVRVRDCIAYCQQYGIDPGMMICKCYTCGQVKDIRDMHAGHYRSRGHGGHSGIYFAEEALKAQCVRCNTYDDGRPEEFRTNLIKELGDEAIEMLHKLHHINRYKKEDLIVLKEIYRTQVKQLCEEYSIEKWWLRK